MKFDKDDCGWIIEDDDLLADKKYEEFSGRPFRMPEDALVVLLAAEVVVPLNGGESGICLQVLCNDTFCYACADAEPIPPIGFGEEGDEPFWKLWDLWKADHDYGAMQWCILQRKMRPLREWEETLKKRGLWTEEMEALPERK